MDFNPQIHRGSSLSLISFVSCRPSTHIAKNNLNVASVPPTSSQSPPTNQRWPRYNLPRIHLDPDHRSTEFQLNFNPRTPHGCSLSLVRFLFRRELLCNLIRIRQPSDVFGAFATSRKVPSKLTPFPLGSSSLDCLFFGLE